jgi:excisionase family DNA binding protein
MARISSIPIEARSLVGTAEAARRIGVSKRTLLQWIYQGTLRETKWVRIAGVDWRVWTPKDIERAKKVKAGTRRGPKRQEGKTAR